ncbi:hypothetical protein [Streptomonospora arabica]|uniref:Uncharacterized protein n=1 Tax=Streptomonospora arabica TaxID=412417 RepID=A0ABV9SIV8_9ACTN
MPDDLRRAAPAQSPMLPPYQAILAVDAERYSRASSLDQRLISGSVRSALEEAFHRAGMADQWNDARFPQGTGDGFALGIAPEYLPLLIHPFFAYLQDTLEQMQGPLAARDRDLRLRLRAAVEVGPLHDSGGADHLDGVGNPMTEVHRLLDSPPVRAGLSQSVPDITLLSTIVSRRVYEDAVLSEYAALNPRHFSPVRAEIAEKEYRSEAYVYIPRPSTLTGEWPVSGASAGKSEPDPEGPVDDGESGAPEARGAAEAAQAASADRGSTANQAGSVSGGGVQAGTVHSGLHTGDHSGNRYGGVGNIDGGVRTLVTGASGPVHTGDGDQYNDDVDGSRRARADRGGSAERGRSQEQGEDGGVGR